MELYHPAKRMINFVTIPKIIEDCTICTETSMIVFNKRTVGTVEKLIFIYLTSFSHHSG